MGPGRGRYRHRGHFEPCAGSARRHRLRRSARSGTSREQRPGSGGRRIGEGGVRRTRAGLGRSDRGQSGGRRRSVRGQQRSGRRRLVLQDPARQSRRARRPYGRGCLPRVDQDALNPAAAQNPTSTSKWNAADYARVGGFVAELGGAALDLLDPQPGEHILDVGCGEGTLTKKIVERGASVLGIDNSPEMIAAARASGIDAVLMDVADMTLTSEFHAAFSNATLHWVLEKEQAARAIFRALKPG